MTVKVEDSLIGGMAEARLEWHMDNWRRLMRSDVIVDGYPGRSTRLSSGGGSSTFDELVDAADKRCAEAVDALMESLSMGERIAINHTYLHAVYRLERQSLPELLQAARVKIARGLKARGIY